MAERELSLQVRSVGPYSSPTGVSGAIVGSGEDLLIKFAAPQRLPTEVCRECS
jgi:hypothetical protein